MGLKELFEGRERKALLLSLLPVFRPLLWTVWDTGACWDTTDNMLMQGVGGAGVYTEKGLVMPALAGRGTSGKPWRRQLKLLPVCRERYISSSKDTWQIPEKLWSASWMLPANFTSC